MTAAQARFTYNLLDYPSIAPGPGALGRGGVASAVQFAAGSGVYNLDLFAAFWADEAPGLDWLRHFLCDPAMDTFLERLAHPPEEEEEPDILYTRSQLTTLGSEVMDGP